MKIPKKLQIAGKVYDIRMVKGFYKKTDTWADICYSDSLINIDSDLSEQDVGISFLHEITHGILITMGRKDLKSDEQFVECFSELLYQVIRQTT